MRGKKRFEQMEIPDTKVPEKKPLLQKLGFKRNIELGSEARDERIRNEFKVISADLDKQVEANEKRRELERRRDAAKRLEQNKKERLEELELEEQFIKNRQEKARRKIHQGVFMGGAFLLVLFLSGGGSIFSGSHSLEILLGIVFAILSYYARRRR